MATSINAMARRLRITWLKAFSTPLFPWEGESAMRRDAWEAVAIAALEERKKARALQPQRAYTDDELQERFDDAFHRIAALEERTK
jgi:hypothetical protein